MQGLKHEESGSEDEWTEDEEEGTALQDIEPFSVVADTLRGVQAHNPARFQARPLAALTLYLQPGDCAYTVAGAGCRWCPASCMHMHGIWCTAC